MRYVKEEVENMLREHLKNEAKLTEIKLKQEEYEERLSYAGTVYEDTEKEVIENMQLAGKGYDTININTNSTSDKTARTAMTYHKEQYYINKEDRAFLENKLKEFKQTEDELNKKIVRVRNMLEPLTEDEEFIVRTYYMKKSKWNYVEIAYMNEFEVHKSIKQLQAYRDNALDNMLDTINTGED